MLARIGSAIVLVSAVLASTAIPAAGEPPAPGAYKALGESGLVMCGAFEQEMQKGPNGNLMLGFSVISWIEGYITAYNATLSASPIVGGDLAKGLSEEDVLHWIVEFCAEHPNEPIAAAAGQAVMHLFQLASSRARAE